MELNCQIFHFFIPPLLLRLVNEEKWLIFCVRDPVILDHEITIGLLGQLIE